MHGAIFFLVLFACAVIATMLFNRHTKKSKERIKNTWMKMFYELKATADRLGFTIEYGQPHERLGIYIGDLDKADPENPLTFMQIAMIIFYPIDGVQDCKIEYTTWEEATYANTPPEEQWELGFGFSRPCIRNRHRIEKVVPFSAHEAITDLIRRHMESEYRGPQVQERRKRAAFNESVA